MRTVALSEHTATRLAYRQYLGLLAEDDRGFRQAFRTAFFRAMREQLTPRQYEVLWMIEVEGLSCKQCAERLGISPSAVSRHCSRGKKRLRTLLAYNLELRHQYFSYLQAKTGTYRGFSPYVPVLFVEFCRALTAYCYTYGLLYAGATQGELPEGQEKVPWGMTSAHRF